MVSISCILPSARESFAILGLPELHIFQPTLTSLAKQSFKDFELIIVDALYPRDQEGKWPFKVKDWPFQLKYVPVHPNHRFWLDRGRWNVCGQLNTALMHAEGELVCRFDDCSEFDEGYLQRAWDEYQKTGRFLLGMHTRFRNGKQAYYDEDYKRNGYDANPSLRGVKEDPHRTEILDRLFGGGRPVRDTRWDVVIQHGERMVVPDDWWWFYGYSSLSMEAALKVNGFDESFDGDKSSEDQDLGSRMVRAGYRSMFVLDVNHWVIEHEHYPVSPSLIKPDPRIMKCNYGLFQLNAARNTWRANMERLTHSDADWIRNKVCPICGNYKRCLDEELKASFYTDEALLTEWLLGERVFDLREERLSV